VSLGRTLSTAFIALSLGSGLAFAQQQQCLTREEAVAVKARVLQTELMVATLSCARAIDQSGHYNAFIDRHSAELQRFNRVLQQHFTRLGTGNPQRRYDTFATALANDASNRSMASQSFCEETVKQFEDVAHIARGKLGDHVEAQVKNGQMRAGELCGRDPAMQYARAP
jgi:hypothetical protein